MTVVQAQEQVNTGDDLHLVGAELDVPLVTGGWRRYVNLDYAASTPCLVPVKLAVDALLPWYSSVHRGAGYKSRIATDAFEGARQAVHGFVRGRPDDAVIFTRNTTDAINLLVALAVRHFLRCRDSYSRMTTTLPLACPSPRYRRASGTSPNR